MLYRYFCNGCGAYNERAFFGKLNDPEWNPPEHVNCDACGDDAYRMYDSTVMVDASHATETQTLDRPTSGHSQFDLVGSGFPGQDIRTAEQADEIEQIMDEPLTDEEMAVGRHMLEEREREKGFTPGALSGERPQEDVVMIEMTPEEYRKHQRETKQQMERDFGPSVGAVEAKQSLDGSKVVVQTKDGKKKIQIVGQRTVRQGEEKLKQRAQEQKTMREQQS